MVSQEWLPLVTLKLYSQLKDVKECGKFVHDQRYILACYYTAVFSFVTQQDEEEGDEEKHCIRILKTAV